MSDPQQQQALIGWQAQAGGPPAAPNGNAGDSKQPAPSAPPISAFTPLPGYEGTTFDGGFAPAPPPPPSVVDPSAGGPAAPIDADQHVLTDAEARSYLREFVSEHCCYGKAPANDMKIVEIVPTSAFKYTLDTFTEKREATWKYEPNSGPEMPPLGLPVPAPWQVPVAPPKLFKDGGTFVEVPNSSSVIRCHACQGHGDVRCEDCHGRGYETCSSCSGTGTRVGDESCTWCDGTGSRACTWCNRSGMRQCRTCNGMRYLRCYVNLEVTWRKHDDTHVAETTPLPNELIKKVEGRTVFSDERQRVAPVTAFPDQQIGQASAQLVQKHATKWPAELIIMQRHSVQLVPVHTVQYTLDGNDGQFHVYGHEHKVHFPDYPSQCCGCCVVM